MKKTMIKSLTVALFALAIPQLATTAQRQIQYPKTRTVDHVDTYHGTEVADPYRWLEDLSSTETAKWVDEQNKVTFGYLEKIPFRAKIKARLTQLDNFPKYFPPRPPRRIFLLFKERWVAEPERAVYPERPRRKA